jgi:hypothetical protein
MADAKMDVKIGGVSFSGEGEAKWLRARKRIT